MTNGWYYAHDGERRGPFTGRQLRILALSGRILRTDSVYREGIEAGVEASEVKNLFAIVPTPARVTSVAEPVSVVAEPLPIPAPEPVPVSVPAPNIAPPPQVAAPMRAPRKFSAIAVKGAVVMSQDGERVKYKKKCTKCQHEDSSWTTAPITVGTMKAIYFCPKCSQRREVELRGRQQ